MRGRRPALHATRHVSFDVRLGNRTKVLWNGVLALALAICGLTTAACGTQSATDQPRSESSDYAFEQMRLSGESLEGLQPVDLTQALPNHQVYPRDREDLATSFSDLIISGHITKVEQGQAIAWGLDEGDFRTVDFEDPDADTRTVVVTTQVAATTGEAVEVGADLRWFMRIPLDADPQRFVGSLRDIDEVVLVLSHSPSKIRERGAEWRPIMGDRAIGLPNSDGSLSFPGIDDAPGEFSDGLTVADLFREARRPITTEELDVSGYEPAEEN
jgi:hypothetical protein